MTIYVHFVAGASPVKKLHNVDAIRDAGMRAIEVHLTFGAPQYFHHVSHVALQLQDDDE